MSAGEEASGQLPAFEVAYAERQGLVWATLGPETDHPDVLTMVAQLSDVGRIHGAHNSIGKYTGRAHTFLETAREVGNKGARVNGDMEGFKPRTSDGTVPTVVEAGSPISFMWEQLGTAEGAVGTVDDIHKYVDEGDPVSMQDGKMWMKVVAKESNGRVHCEVLSTPRGKPYKVVEHKGLNMPNSIGPEGLLDRDREMMRQYAGSLVVPHLIGLSYTQSPRILEEAIDHARALGMSDEVGFVLKLENRAGWRNAREIFDASRPQDVIMAALGDFGPEMLNQREHIFQFLCDLGRYGKEYQRQWVACTGLAPSMTEQDMASNAEYIALSFVAQLGGDLALSGDELAMNGNYPVEAVRTLRRVADYFVNEDANRTNGIYGSGSNVGGLAVSGAIRH